MRILKLLNGVSANSTGDSIPLPSRPVGVDEMLAQIEITDTATVTIEGRLHSDLPWTTLTSQTSSTLIPVAWVPFVRAVVSGYSAGNCSAYVGYF